MGFKRKKEPTEKPAPVVKEKYPKKPKTCHQIHRGVCEKHDRPCRIIVAYPKNDSRNHWRRALNGMGAENHTRESEHRCEVCEEERQENSPWKELEVEGLDAAQQARIRREAEEWNRRFLEKP